MKDPISMLDRTSSFEYQEVPKMSEDWSRLMNSLSQEQLVQMGQQIERATKAEKPWKPVPVKVALRIALVKTPTVSPDKLCPALERAFGEATPLALEDLYALQNATPRLHEWVEASREHAALLAVNPAAALRQADLGLDEELMDRLENLLRKGGAFVPDPAITIDSVQLATKKTNTNNVCTEENTHG